MCTAGTKDAIGVEASELCYNDEQQHGCPAGQRCSADGSGTCEVPPPPPCPACQSRASSMASCEFSCSMTGGCANVNCTTPLQCTDVVAGWNGNICEKFDENAPGRCTMNGGCAASNAVELCPSSLARSAVQTCGDAKCRKECVPGTAASVYGTVAAVCVVGARGSCDTGFSCDNTGTCVMDPTMVPTAPPTPMPPPPPKCGNSVIDPGEDCESGVCCDNCKFRASTFECRAAAGLCDKAEQCSGTSADCPVNTFEPAGVECRAAVGVCDRAEVCAGGTASCPKDEFQASSVVCRAKAGACDVAENCTGSSGACPRDAFLPTGRECRASAGVCDVAEKCDGSSAVCPSNKFVSNRVVCRARASACDEAENCSGSSAACPADVNKPIGATCDDANRCTIDDVCNDKGVCTGKFNCMCRTNADCDDKNPCSIDRCGSNSACVYTVAPAGAQCRAKAGVCDVAEKCDGTSIECPPDVFVQQGTMCRDADGVCDQAEFCTGRAAACPADQMAPSSQVCRAAVGPCDRAETCDGISVECPADAAAVRGTVCRASVSDCDAQEVCNGVSNQCPNDVAKPNGASCMALYKICDGGSGCVSGMCSTKLACSCVTVDSCQDNNPCTSEACVDGKCVYNPVSVGTPCDDADPCTVGDQCASTGFCEGQTVECQHNCNNHGVCCGGQCQCDSTRTGVVCELDLNGELVPGAMKAPNTPDNIESNAASDGGNVGLIVGVAVAAVCCVLILIVGFVFARRMLAERREEQQVRNAVMHSVNSHAQPAAELPTQMNGHPQIISFDTMPVVHVGGSQLSTDGTSQFDSLPRVGAAPSSIPSDQFQSLQRGQFDSLARSGYDESLRAPTRPLPSLQISSPYAKTTIAKPDYSQVPQFSDEVSSVKPVATYQEVPPSTDHAYGAMAFETSSTDQYQQLTMGRGDNNIDDNDPDPYRTMPTSPHDVPPLSAASLKRQNTNNTAARQVYAGVDWAQSTRSMGTSTRDQYADIHIPNTNSGTISPRPTRPLPPLVGGPRPLPPLTRPAGV